MGAQRIRLMIAPMELAILHLEQNVRGEWFCLSCGTVEPRKRYDGTTLCCGDKFTYNKESVIQNLQSAIKALEIEKEKAKERSVQ